MTISTTTTKILHDGDNSTLTFAYSFRVYAAGDLTVYKTYAGTDTLQVLDTNYSVSINATTTNPGGSITFVSAPGSAETITIYRDLTVTQSTAYTVGGAFPAAAHETALDRLTLLVQDLTERVDRRTPDYDVTSSGTAPY